MTAAEMIIAFKIGYDIANLDGPAYEDDEIFVMLNEAQVIVVLNKLKAGQITHISNLIVNEDGVLTAGHLYSNTAIYDISETDGEYIGFLSAKVLATRTSFKATSGDEWLECELIHKWQSGWYVTNTLNTPILLKPKVYEDSDRTITVIYDDYTTPELVASGFYLEYIRKPSDIATGSDCELNTILHEDIVNTAITQAKKVFQPQEAAIGLQVDNNQQNKR